MTERMSHPFEHIAIAAREWLNSLTRREKAVVESRVRNLLFGEEYQPTPTDRTHQSHASTKADRIGLGEGVLFSPTNTSKGSKPVELAALYILANEQFTPHLFRILLGQENVRVVRESLEALNAHDIKRFGEALHEEHIWESVTLPAPVYGREAACQAMQAYWAAVPDLHFYYEIVPVDITRVFSQWRAVATHQGEFMGIPATNRPTNVRGFSLYTIEDSKIVRAETYWNLETLKQQMLSDVSPMGDALAAAT